MKRFFSLAALLLPLIMTGCKKTTNGTGNPDVAGAANAAPSPETPLTGNNYKVTFKALRQNTLPAVGFKVDAWVKGKSEPSTKVTDANGVAEWTDLPTPDATHQLNTILHYYAGKRDQSREISYPFIESDATRLKDTQYIPNTVTPDPQ